MQKNESSGTATSETPDEVATRALERERIVKWMRSVLAEKPDKAEQKAFMNKVSSAASYHGITLEELLEEDPPSK